jgi:GntR family transcriptional regulator
MLQEIESMARHSVVKVIEINDERPPAEVSDKFNLNNEDTTLKMIRVRSQDKEPFGYYISWSRGLGSCISEDSLKTNSRLEIFRKNGIHITHVKQTLTAASASAEVASELEVEPGFSLLKLVRESFDKNENLVDFLVALYHPERFQYQMDLTVESEP